MPTYAKHREEQKKQVDYQKPPEVAAAVRLAYIYKNDVRERGSTPGCDACGNAMSGANTTGYFVFKK